MIRRRSNKSIYIYILVWTREYTFTVGRTEQRVLEKSATETHLLNSTFGRTFGRTLDQHGRDQPNRAGPAHSLAARPRPAEPSWAGAQSGAVILNAKCFRSKLEE